MLRTLPQRVLLTALALTGVLGFVLFFATHGAVPHQRCPFMSGTCETQAASMDRHIDALQTISTATLTREAASTPLLLTVLLLSTLALIRLSGTSARRPGFYRENFSQRFLTWLVLLEQRAPMVRRYAV